ncbi:MAG: DNA polymerase IV [Gammaproteobacteria bacterium]|nr:DNA polymerase IV [Gammaproteobacteria bacterium]
MSDNPQYWPRLIAFVDMDAFFASVEQRDRPEYRGRPIGITNGRTGTCLITCSYEARVFGIHIGMRLRQARQLCPGLIQVPSRPERYAAVSTRIMEVLRRVTPDVEVFSVDEAFLDLTHCQKYWNRPPGVMGKVIKELVCEASGLACTVGLSGDKTTAKYAAKQQKPNGLAIIPPWETRERLKDVPVARLCGVGRGIAGFLARRGALTCGEVARLPVSVLGDRFGNPGRRVWQMCRGEDSAPVETRVAPPKSLGHGKIMPPDTTDRDVICMYLVHMAEKLGARLRQHSLVAQRYAVGLRTQEGWIRSNRLKTTFPTNDSRDVVELCNRMVDECWRGEGVFQVQVSALDPRPARGQGELFTEEETRCHRLNQVMDEINDRYGEFTLTRASLMQRSEMPNVIAPAWKPYGHRQTIVPTAGREAGTGVESKSPPGKKRGVTAS